LAIGGVWHTPHLTMAAAKDDKPHEWALSPDNVHKIVYGMYGVVNEGGTGVRARIPNLEVCGKTGSAQTVSNEYAKTHKDVKDNAWFVEFAPCYKPEIVISVLWEGGVHGMYGAPMARDVMVAYFDKKARLAEAEKLKQSPASTLMSALTPRSAGVTASPLDSNGQAEAPVAH
jgi:penicillin-binding protein 2